MPIQITKNFCLPITVFEGGGGDIVLMQEFPGIEEEVYLRVFAAMEDAEKICADIMRVATQARLRGKG